MVSGFLLFGRLDGGEKNWSLGWRAVGMGSLWIAGALGDDLSACDSTGFRWLDSHDISNRMGRFSPASWFDLLWGGDSDWSNFKDQWA
jgi:hypothetical protein